MRLTNQIFGLVFILLLSPFPSRADSRPLLVASFCHSVGGWDLDRARILKRFQALNYEIREVPCTRQALTSVQIQTERRGIFFYSGHGSARESSGLFGSKLNFVFNAQDQDVLGKELIPRIPKNFFQRFI